MRIRDVRPSDFEDIVETFLSFFPEGQEDPGFGLTLSRQKPTMADEHRWFSEILKEIEAGNVIFTVAEVKHHVVGWCDVRRVRPGGPLDHRGGLGICIRKEFRSKGIGTALMRKTLAKCKGRFEIVELNVLATNTGAHELYKQFGFKDHGLLPGGVKRGNRYIDEHFMYLKL